MHKIKLLALGLALQALLFACRKKEPENNTPEKQDKPNVVLILADDLGFECLGVNGCTEYNTPNLDKLAKQGIRFTECFSTPLCTPSRVEIMTGKYNNQNYVKFGLLKPDQKTFAHYAKEQDYITAIAGKWQLGGNKQAPYQFGFDSYCLWQTTYPGFWHRYKEPKIMQDTNFIEANDKFGPDVFTNYVNDFITQNADTNFFVYYPMCLVHDPFQPTPLDTAYPTHDPDNHVNDSTYFEQYVTYMDSLVGSIVTTLEKNGLANNTLILFTGDNGTDTDVVTHFKNKPIRGEKGKPTYYGTHVPLIAYWPSKIKPGQTNNDLIDFTDVLPTLADAIGHQNKADDLQGLSFFNRLLGQQDTARTWSFCYYHSGKPQFKNAEFIQNKEWKIYSDSTVVNIKTDPQELKKYKLSDSLMQENPVLKRLQNQLEAMLKNP